MMKKGYPLCVALLLTLSLLLSGCGAGVTAETASSEAVPAAGQDGPLDSLEGTAWIVQGEVEPERCLAFFFQDGVLSVKNGDFDFNATYYFHDGVMETDPEEVGYVGTVEGGRMSVTSFGAPYREMTLVSAEEALAYARAIDPDYADPFADAESLPESAPTADPRLTEGRVILENQYVTVRFIQRETKPVAGMLEGKVVMFHLPTVLLSVQNNSGGTLHFESNGVEGAEYGFVLSNEKGAFDYSGMTLGANETLPMNVYYSQVRYEKVEWPLDTLDDKEFFIRLYVPNEYGGFNFVEQYHFYTNDLQ